MSIINFNPFNTPTFPTIPLSPTLVLDIQDYTHLWFRSEDSAYYAESADWGRNPAIFEADRITVTFDLFVYSGKVYLA